MGLSRRNVFLCNDDYEWFQKHAKTLDERNAAYCIREAMRDYRKKHEKKKKPKEQAVTVAQDAVGHLDCTNGKYPVTQADMDAWSTAYPAVDVGMELNKIQAWLHSNPAKRKTVNGCKRFINNWLAKTQDRGGNNGQLQNQHAASYQNRCSAGAKQLEQSAAALQQWERNHQGQEQAGMVVGEWQGVVQHKMD